MKTDRDDIKAYNWSKLRNPLKVILTNFVFEICRILPFLKFKNKIYRALGVEIGENVFIAPHVLIDPIFPEKIKIKDGAVIGWGADLFTHSFDHNGAETGEIIIGENSVVGAESVVLPGSKIGDNTMIGAHAVVNRDVEDNEQVGGVPIRHIKYLEQDEKDL